MGIIKRDFVMGLDADGEHVPHACRCVFAAVYDWKMGGGMTDVTVIT